MNPREIKKQRVDAVYEQAAAGLNTSAAIAKALKLRQEMVQGYLAEMDKAGRMFRATISVRECYWYTTKEAAQQKLKEHRERERHAPVSIKIKHVSFVGDAKTVRPKGVKVEQGPPFRGLGFSETQPKERAFSSLGVGRYLPDEDAMLRRVARKGA